MKKHTKAVLFDLDGVLIDSSSLVGNAFEYTIRTHDLKNATAEEWSAMKGLPIADVYARLGGTQIENICRTHAEFQNANLHLVTAYPNAISVLETLRGAGVKTGVITNRSRNARSIMQHCGLLNLVDLVVSIEDVTNPKPHPEGILKAMSTFTVTSDEAVMLGDMPVDLQAAKAAGVGSIAVNTGDCLEELNRHNPDHVIEDLEELVPLLGLN